MDDNLDAIITVSRNGKIEYMETSSQFNFIQLLDIKMSILEKFPDCDVEIQIGDEGRTI